MKLKSLRLAPLALLALLTAAPASAQQLPGRHPAYVHALSDLRQARWLLNHQPGDAKIYANEDIAISEVDIAIREIRHAAIGDDKDLSERPPADAKQYGSRLLRAIESLKKARADISGAEDNPEVRGLRARAFEHIDNAIAAADRAHRHWVHLRG